MAQFAASFYCFAFLLYFFSFTSIASEREEVDEILGIMQTHLINRDKMDWSALEQNTSKILAESEQPEARFKAIQYLLAKADTNHSFYRSLTPKRFIFPHNLACTQALPALPEIPEDIGYIVIPGFSKPDRAAQIAFAESIQQQIERQDTADLKGWIIDLQNNRGGNMWPMLAGLSPLLSKEIHGYFIKPDGEEVPWGTIPGASILNNRKLIRLSKVQKLNNIGRPMAVLSSKRTASSGEAVLIALQGQRNVKTFGQNSCGQSSANRMFKLKSGNQLTLTVSHMADKHKQRFGGPVATDVQTETPYQDAIAWITAR